MKVRHSSRAAQGFGLLIGLAVGSSAFGASLIENVTQTAYTQAEQAITINRANPNRIFIATNGRGGYGEQTYLVSARSRDGGHTWLRGTFANGSDGLPEACCDPSLTSDRFGNLYVAYLASSTLTPDQSLEVMVGRSTDGGATWTLLANLGPGDEPTITAGPGKTPAEQSIWVTWTNDGAGRLLAAGATATGQGILQGSFSPREVLKSKTVEGYGDLAIGPGGKVVVAHQDINCVEGPDAIRVNTNRRGLGGKFGSTVTATPPDPNNVVIGACRHIPAQPIRSVDAEVGLAWNPKTNRLLMVYTDETSDSFNQSTDSNGINGIYDTNIELIYSDDDGATWSSPLRLNDDHTHRSQFLPKIALDPTTGHLVVVWYDARNDDGSGADGQRDFKANDEAELWGTLSLDDGRHFVPNFKISAGMSSAPLAENVVFPDDPGFDYGDYIGLDFFNRIIRPVWADNSNSTHDNPDRTGWSFDAYTCQFSPFSWSHPLSAEGVNEGCSNRTLDGSGFGPQ